jgi:hypothetical protein
MARHFSGRQAEFRSAAGSDNCPQSAHCSPAYTIRDFQRADPGLFAFFVDDFLDCPPGSLQLELPEFSFLGLFEYRMDKISAPQYALVPLFLFPRPASGYDLGTIWGQGTIWGHPFEGSPSSEKAHPVTRK